MHRETRTAAVAVLSLLLLLVAAVPGPGAVPHAAAATPDDQLTPHGPIVERDGDPDPGELPSERDVPPQPELVPGSNDTINGDVDLRDRRDLETGGAIGGTPPGPSVLDRLRDVVLVLGVVVVTAFVLGGVVLWRRR